MKNRLILAILILLSSRVKTFAQEGKIYDEGDKIQGVFFVFKNPLEDSLLQNNIRTKIERVFPVYPQTNIRTIIIDAYTARVRQLPEVADASYEIRPAQTGDLDLTLTITLADKLKVQKNSMGLFSGEKDFPLLYQDKKSLLTTKFAFSEMLYSNNNAWYSRDDVMLQGNPLVDQPAGKGYTGWIEGWASAGIYGITTLSAKQNIYLYGGANYIVSGSAGRELFTDKPRFFGAFDDAYGGILGTTALKNGSRFTYNVSAGRQQFSIGQGFIIRNTASNGSDRGALQLNPRWAADYLGLASIKYNNFLIQGFRLNPDELPVVDSKTIIHGINLEWGGKQSSQVGFSYLHVPHSLSNYYTPDGAIFSREGLQVYNLRYYRNRPTGVPGLMYKTEIAFETNTNYNMAAKAGYGELGWSFAKNKWTPVIIYRFAYFSGDNPKTERFERWDPLLTGGNGEDWVLGANHFKIVQNSNILVHKIQASFRPSIKFELVPQLLYMYAAQHNNIGGNPALCYMAKKEYGYEANLSWKYFHSRRWYFHGHFAYTLPGAGVKQALGNTKPWFSAMVFFRYSIN